MNIQVFWDVRWVIDECLTIWTRVSPLFFMDCQNLRLVATGPSEKPTTVYQAAWPNTTKYLISKVLFFTLLLYVFLLYILVRYTSSNYKCVWEFCSLCYCILFPHSIHNKGFSSRTSSYIIRSLFCLWCNIPTRTKVSFLLRFLHHTRLDTHTSWDYCCGMNISSHRPLPTQHTTNTRDGHAYPQLDSNPQFQQSTASNLRFRRHGHRDHSFGGDLRTGLEKERRS